jgi:hypothetical protein
MNGKHFESCKKLNHLKKDKKYIVQKFVKADGDSKKIFAIVKHYKIDKRYRVHLPGLDTSRITDEEIKSYNQQSPSLYLVYRGLKGKLHNFEFLRL